MTQRKKAKTPAKPEDAHKKEATAISDAGFPIVGIGASAGGLAAFEAFFSGMPSKGDPGMAFVLVQHLAPDHTSILTEIIQRYTRMKVFEVKDGMRVEPNCVYIIPPGYDMAFLNGELQLIEPIGSHGKRLPINFFFRSLAQDQHEHSIGIVLSGTGSDGTQGIRDIKNEGGIVIAQAPDTTEYDGMPRSAIATGLVDYILPPSEMARQLITHNAYALKNITAHELGSNPKAQNMLDKIFILLRAQTGHDFSQYKQNTIHRRIERRLAICQIETIAEYVKYLQQTPAEVEALFRDLLIGVTNFFRDPEAFSSLKEEVIPKLFALKSTEGVIRVWCIGCSSGEEAYSIAILLKEYMEEIKQSVAVQIFATDIDAQAIAAARSGLYPASIAADVSPERLARFFISEPAGYRIHKSIRDMLIFSVQNVIKDPPFSKLDLISCRNLLIYMNSDLQKKLIPLFGYALNPGGILFLGSSESIGEFGDLFSVLNQKSKIYRRTEDMYGAGRAALVRTLPRTSAVHMPSPQTVEKIPAAAALPLRELTEQALLQFVHLSGALVNDEGDILYLHGRTGMYLELPPGEAGINNILKMAREGLRHELTRALRKSAMTKESVYCPRLKVQNNGICTTVNLTVRSVPTNVLNKNEPFLYLVILEEVAVDAAHPVRSDDSPGKAEGRDESGRIAALQQELYEQEAFLQIANKKLEISNEELKSFNEEMQSLNEELQSTNEELETSKEELQSVNEELSTINAELQTKVADLSRANNDMNNLLAGTNIGTLFVDHKLCIMRFTPAVTRIINLIQSDLGRPVSHIVSNLVGYDTLAKDIRAVLDTLIPKDVEVCTTEGRWYSMRIQPYRTVENVIEGGVISFIEITEIVQMREALKKANEASRLAVVVRDSYDAITVQDLNGRIQAWNSGAVRMYGWSEAEALSMNARDRILQADQDEEMLKIARLSRSETVEPYQARRLAKEGSVVNVWVTATALVNEAGAVYAIATTEHLMVSKKT